MLQRRRGARKKVELSLRCRCADAPARAKIITNGTNGRIRRMKRADRVRKRSNTSAESGSGGGRAAQSGHSERRPSPDGRSRGIWQGGHWMSRSQPQRLAGQIPRLRVAPVGMTGGETRARAVAACRGDGSPHARKVASHVFTWPKCYEKRDPFAVADRVFAGLPGFHPSSFPLRAIRPFVSFVICL